MTWVPNFCQIVGFPFCIFAKLITLLRFPCLLLIMRLPLTLHIQSGRKLADKSKDEILSEIKKAFKAENLRSVQICYDTIRVTFYSPEIFQRAKANTGLYIFGLWCAILGGGPPATSVNLFDYPFEEEDIKIEEVFCAFGEVKRIRHQTFVSDANIFTGTRLVSIVLRSGVTLPRFININGYNCKIWYRGQPLICNLCAVQGHRSANCPNKDKCRRCGASGHFARACTNPWRINQAPDVNPPEDPPVGPCIADLPAGSSGASGMDPPVDPFPDPPVASSEDDFLSPPVGSSASVSQVEAVVFSESSPSHVESSPEIGQFSSQTPASSEPIDSFSASQSILHNVEISNVADNSVVDNNEVVLIDSGDLIGSKTPVTYDNNSSGNSEREDGIIESIVNSAPGETMELDPSGPSKPRARSRDEEDVGFLSKIPRFSPRKLISKTPKVKVMKAGQAKHQMPAVVPARPGKK